MKRFKQIQRMMRQIIARGWVAGLILGGLVQTVGAQQYTVTELTGFEAASINNHGMIAGSSSGQAALWNAGTVTLLEPVNPTWVSSRATAISDSGAVVGWGVPSGSGVQRDTAFFWNGLSMIPLQGPAGALISYAKAVNDHNQVVGYYGDGSGTYHSFLWENNTVFEVGISPSPAVGQFFSFANAINDAGLVVGAVQGDAYRWENGVQTWLPEVHANTVTGYSAEDVNDAGQIVGWGEGHAVLWDGQTITVLAVDPAFIYEQAFAINNQGQIVGYDTDWSWPTSSIPHALLWENGVVFDLNNLIPVDSGISLRRALDINDAGQILAYGQRSGDSAYVTTYVLLTPVPEIGTLELFLLGMGAATIFRVILRRKTSSSVDGSSA